MIGTNACRFVQSVALGEHYDFCSFSAVDDRRRPSGGAARKPVFGRFALVSDGNGRPDECGSVIETVGIDHRAGASRGIADGADIDAAAPAIEEIGGARTEAVGFNKRSILGRDLDRTMRIARRARVVGAAEPTSAGTQRRVLGRLRQAQV